MVRMEGSVAEQNRLFEPPQAGSHAANGRSGDGYLYARPTGVDRIATVAAAGQMSLSDFSLLGHFQSVVDLGAEVADRTFQFGMPEQQLHGPEVFGAPMP